jgi:hypothetical protein
MTHLDVADSSLQPGMLCMGEQVAVRMHVRAV